MRRVQSLEFNNNSSSSISHQPKKVSLPPLNETDSVTRPSFGWIRRSAANINARSTVVPMTVNQDEIPNYFNSTMQSMCLAFFTLAYTELIDDAVFSGHSLITHAFLKFLSILCIGLALLAAFSSIRVFLFTCQLTETNSTSSKLYSTLARLGSIITAFACGIIISIFALISLYVAFSGRTV